MISGQHHGATTNRIGPPAAEADATPRATAEADVTPAPDAGTASNGVIMAVGSLVSRLTGFLRTVLIGAALGATVGGVGDAYTTAQMLPSQIYELVLGAVGASVLVPVLVRRRRLDADGGQAYTQTLLTLALLALGVTTVLAVVAAPLFAAIYAGSRPADYRDLVTVLSYLLLPMIFFIGLSVVIGTVLNVRGHFAAPMWVPILNNVVMIGVCGGYIALFTAREITPAQMTPGEIAVIGGGTLLGMVAQTLALLPALHKVGFRWRLRWNPRSLGLAELARLAGWMLCFVATNQVGLFVVVQLFSRADAGAGLLVYNNVYLLVMMAHGVVGVSVMTALLPRMSDAAARNQLGEVSADLSRGLRTVMAALAPVVALYAVLASPIAVVLFQWGAFGTDEAQATATVLVVGACAVIPLSVSYLCNFTFYSMRGNKTVALINMVGMSMRVVVQILLTILLAESLTAAGLMLGNAVSYVGAAAISLTVLRRRIGRLGLPAIAASGAKVAVAVTGAAALGWLVLRLLPGAGTPSFGQAVAQLSVGGVVIVGGYLALAWTLRVREVTAVVGMVRRRLGR
ncbi:murein biosynthesis integral membrane protein MurJ [Plantactinospora sp. WMMB334]|uniref:murein biosynthesis integral membrane protein MurJ n=1 Tax=Plantactinospora sp. WMMB334 TaxID=3404119 RepID=UPI003B934703